MKKFILGFITGGIICAAVTGIAVEYAVTANPYPVKVDGQAAAIEGYNINDSTYFKLRDVADAVGGFSVDFKDDTIVINTAAKSTPTPTSVPTAKPNLSPLPEVEIETWDGAEYVRKSNIEAMLESIGLGNYKFTSVAFYDSTRDDGMAVIENMPHHPTNNELIPVDYYNNTVVPAINSLR